MGTKGAAVGASGWYTRTPGRTVNLSNLRPEMAKAFHDVMGAIFRRNQTRAEAVREKELALETHRSNVDIQKTRLAAHLANNQGENATSLSKKFVKDSAAYIRSQEISLRVAGEQLAKLRDEAESFDPRKVRTSYDREAVNLSGKSGEKGYWARPTEMFARAFESFVHDKIAAEDRSSQYLVQGVEPERYATGYKGNPYPAGMEREAINAAFDHLFKAMDAREGEHGPVLFQRSAPTDHPDLFAAMEPLAPRPSTGPFAKPADDPGRTYFDHPQNHADLERLGRAAILKGRHRRPDRRRDPPGWPARWGRTWNWDGALATPSRPSASPRMASRPMPPCCAPPRTTPARCAMSPTSAATPGTTPRLTTTR